jgi:hypothetical protein
MVVLWGEAVSYERGTPVQRSAFVEYAILQKGELCRIEHPEYSRPNGPRRGLTPNTVDLTARGGLVLDSVLLVGLA